MPPNPERHLRRLIVELSELSPDDAAAILADLSQGERDRVETLLQDYAGAHTKPANELSLVDGLDLSNISPWLRERLEHPTAIGVTPQVTETLRTIIERLQPLTSTEHFVDKPGITRSSRFFGKGGAA